MPADQTELHWLLLTAASGRFGGAFAADVARLATRLDTGPAAARSYLRTDVDPAAGSAHGAAMAGGPTPFDAIVEVDGPGVFSGPAPDLRDQLAAGFDLARSGALVGVGHVFAPGGGRFVNVFWIRPAPGLTIAAAQERWRNGHRQALAEMAATSTSVAALTSYTQIHADPAASTALAAALGLGVADLMGAARSFTDDPGSIAARLAQPDIADVALADERAFIDHARSAMALYRCRPVS